MAEVMFTEFQILEAVMLGDIPVASDLAREMLPGELERLIYQVRKMESVLWAVKAEEGKQRG